MANRKSIIISIAGIAAIILVSFAVMGILSDMKEPPKKFEKKTDPRAVLTRIVEYDTLTTSVTATGRIVSREIVQLISEVPGRLLSADIPLKKGQNFRKGDLLVNIYNEDAEFGLKGMKSRFLNSLAHILPDLKIDFTESYDLWKNFLNAINLNNDLPPIPEIKSDKEKIYLAGKNILSEYYSIKSEEIRLKKYKIRAPFNGSYTNVMLEVGSVTNMGARIASMIRTDELEMEVPLSSKDASLIRIGANVKAMSKESNNVWNGKVVRKSGFIAPETQSINVFVRLRPSADKPLYRGMYLKAEFDNMKYKDVIEIPRSCVFNFDEVYIVVENRLQIRKINIIKANENTYLIKGIEEGTDIVIEPLVNVTENSIVQIKNNDQ